MGLQIERKAIGCLALVFIVGMLISNSTSTVYNETYEDSIDLESYYFEENQMILCSIRSTFGMDYSISFRRNPGRFSGPENTERVIEGNTFYMFKFNTSDSYNFHLVANRINGITYHVKFSTSILPLIFNIGMLVFGLTYIIWVIYDRFPSGKRMKKLEEQKKERIRRIIEGN
jgi:hypothetical protein